MQQERDRAIRQLVQVQSIPTDLTQQLEQLQAENSQLRFELERFEAIRRAFLGATPQVIANSPATSPTDSTSAPSVTPPADAMPAPISTTTTVDAATSNGASANPTKSLPKPKSDSSPTKANKTVSVAERSYRPRRKGQALARAENIFHALIAWNTQHPDDTFAMTDWLLEGVFKVNRKAAKEFCQEFHYAIEQHHAQVGIDNVRSHNRGRDTSALKAFVSSFSEPAIRV